MTEKAPEVLEVAPEPVKVTPADPAQAAIEENPVQENPEVPTVTEPTVVILFKTEDGLDVERTFTRRPLGLDWKKKMPLTVERVLPGTQSSEKALRPGWTLVALNGESVSTGAYDVVSAKVKAAVQALPASVLVVAFRKEDGATVEHAFTRRPIGMDWQSKMPITVTRVRPGTQSSEQGLQPGWTLLALNGESVSTGAYDVVSAKVKAAVQALPASVVVAFRKEDGVTVEHAFTRRPIGMDWQSKMPMTVARVLPGTQSSEQGLQPGWTIVALNGENVEAGDYADVSAKVKAAASTLPPHQ